MVYIDGFNLYYGIRDINRYDLMWLNLESLGHSFLDSKTTLSAVKYFTSNLRIDTGKKSQLQASQRQKIYLEALRQLPKVSVVKGSFLPKGYNCKKCNHYYQSYEEKQTDVNIACALLEDAYENRFDVAFLVSGDADLVTPVKKLASMQKIVIVAFPPDRKNHQLKEASTNSFNINIKRLRKNLLPLELTTPKGKKLTCPEQWHQRS